jgi:hypothetical protein
MGGRILSGCDEPCGGPGLRPVEVSEGKPGWLIEGLGPILMYATR